MTKKPHPFGEVAVLGAWADVADSVNDMQRYIDRTGAFANWRSNRIEAKLLSELQDGRPHLLYLYAYSAEGGRAVTHALAFDDVVQVEGTGGMRCPWPQSTFNQDRGKTCRSHKVSEQFRTWFHVIAVHALPREVDLGEFRTMTGGRVTSGSQLRSGVKLVRPMREHAVLADSPATTLPPVDKQTMSEKKPPPTPKGVRTGNLGGWRGPDPEVGRRGEVLVERFERERLIAAGRSDLAHRVRDRHRERDLGWDILSFHEDGTERHIEVKSSGGLWTGTFYLTKAEARACDDDPRFEFAFVWNVKTSSPKIAFRNSDARFVREPIVLRVRSGGPRTRGGR